ncbi:protocadherin-8 isoform X1 [Aquila chrysaetos chrysaetos]|uniref:Protocadherin-8 n=1 Tax=Aquila chrysaetos chrysaetos TaxID=223781 RepID=A0A663FD89_AQUCH|nr:protocadherin-8 isoform X1 [Aquila chrysaetos chrysaetos]XP_029892563.1 protocadherin-8 isoform X1 [Aquila chrysaetos chrysaetos]
MSPLRLLAAASLLALSRCKTVRYRTDEEGAPGTVIGTLAEEMPVKAPGEMSFRLMRQFSNSSLVRVREEDGQLSIGEAGLDRERLCGQAPQCVLAFDVVSCWRERYRLVHVELEVRDINDNAPRFPRAQMTLEVSESAAPGTRLPLEVAVDEDVGSNSIQSFQVSLNSHFGVEAQTRADGARCADLVLLQELDRERQPSYTLELVAKDGGSPARSGTATVRVRVLDANDNSPAFARGSVTVELPEDAPPGSLLLDLDAADPDEGPNGEVVYAFGSQVPPEARRLFRLDPRSGRLTLEAAVDYERARTYELDVRAQDRGASPRAATCTVVVRLTDVNDNAPRISISALRGAASAAGVAYVSEAAASESFVALVSASDRDSGANGQVRCSLRGHDHFALQRAYEDSYMIVTTAALDRERIPEYNLTVVAEDLGSPPFKTVRQYTVRVSDENDNAPLFAKPLYEVAVPENNPPGAYIATVVARDPDLGHNGKVTYRLLETQVMGAPISTYVSVDPATGAIYALRTFNYEILKQLDLRIQATDGGSPQLSSSTLVKVRMVDQNDNPPIIIHPVLTNGTVEIGVSSKTSRDSLVAQIKARDADDGANAELTFAFLEEPRQDLFTINPSTGDIVLRGDLSEELGQMFKVILTVTDNGRPPLATTATVNFLVTATAPSSMQEIAKPSSWEGKALQWDIPLIVIIVLAGSCTLLLVAIITIATTCNRRKKGNEIKNNASLKDQIDISHLEKGRPEEGSQRGNVFEVRTFPSKTSFTSPDPSPAAEEISAAESGSDSACLYEGQKRLRGPSGEQGFAAAPSYGKEPAPPVAIWKGHSFNTISGREAEKFSGKDSGKGDSDFNDSDSDISGDALKKDLITHMQNGLWACTAECKILGHSDRCWSPSCGRANPHPSPHPSAPLSTFCKSTSLPRDPLRRDNFYQAQLPKTVGLQSVYEKVLHRDFDRTITLLSPPRPARLPDLQEIGVPLYPAPSTRYLGPQTDAAEKV